MLFFFKSYFARMHWRNSSAPQSAFPRSSAKQGLSWPSSMSWPSSSSCWSSWSSPSYLTDVLGNYDLGGQFSLHSVLKFLQETKHFFLSYWDQFGLLFSVDINQLPTLTLTFTFCQNIYNKEIYAHSLCIIYNTVRYLIHYKRAKHEPRARWKKNKISSQIWYIRTCMSWQEHASCHGDEEEKQQVYTEEKEEE